ncbi:MAG: hypothetical protein UHG68_01265 [Clostridia bacterium]|nr:hypothetical protein [Clostridia bacterium]
MNKKNTRVRDVPPERVKAIVANMDFADKLMASGFMQIMLAFEAAKAAGKAAAEENKART